MEFGLNPLPAQVIRMHVTNRVPVDRGRGWGVRIQYDAEETPFRDVAAYTSAVRTVNNSSSRMHIHNVNARLIARLSTDSGLPVVMPVTHCLLISCMRSATSILEKLYRIRHNLPIYLETAF